MDFFAAYFKDKYPGVQFKEFKKKQEHPKRILDIMLNGDKVKKRIYM